MEIQWLCQQMFRRYLMKSHTKGRQNLKVTSNMDRKSVERKKIVLINSCISDWRTLTVIFLMDHCVCDTEA